MNLLITGAWKNGKEHLEELKKMGHNVTFLQYETHELSCPYEWVEGIVGNGIFLSHPIEKFKNLRYIQLTSAGYDRVPMDYIQKHGISIYNAGDVYATPMAEFVLSSVLQIYKKATLFYNNQQNQKWEKIRSINELNGKTVCIIGCGNVGRRCSKLFSAFGCKVVGIDLVPSKKDFFDRIGAITERNDILPDADIVLLSLPLTSQTKRMFGARELELLKPGAVLVNISRGGLIVTDELVNRLKKGDLFAVLDVFEEEPLSADHLLWTLPNVTVTPHNSFVGEHNEERLLYQIMKNLTENRNDQRNY